MKTIRVEDAVGTILGQDLTRIVPGEFKGAAFKKGHVITQADIPVLLSMGKDNVYVMELNADEVHENEAAEIVANAIVGGGLTLTEPLEAKVNIIAKHKGMVNIDVDLLMRINELDGIAVATLHNGTVVNENELIASVKIIPLTIPKTTLAIVQKILQSNSVIRLLPFPERKFGMIVTGNEVYYGRIQDKFVPVIKDKLSYFDTTLTEVIFVPDSAEQISEAVSKLIKTNDFVVVSGGMSVDPDDVTPEGIRKSGASVEVYGTPVLPGAMFLLAYLNDKPVLGIPACGMFCKTTILDVVLPKIIIGEKISRRYIASLGHGGLCRNCKEGCRYPICSFGK
ncbi:molybdopterin-binding protein [Dendrosporobacter sp. 1207_IL3150]|uniref:molybdopterin-binding protein n=1 Tax=Dendrosporobacter sp. 1207_IL3150 TaxID=3084054 RepID=UPI002FDB6EF4